MKRKTRQLLARVGILALTLLLLASATLATLSGRVNYRNYFGGVVFAPIAALIAVALIILLYRHIAGKKDPRLKSDDELFEGPLKDWKKW